MPPGKSRWSENFFWTAFLGWVEREFFEWYTVGMLGKEADKYEEFEQKCSVTVSEEQICITKVEEAERTEFHMQVRAFLQAFNIWAKCSIAVFDAGI